MPSARAVSCKAPRSGPAAERHKMDGGGGAQGRPPEKPVSPPAAPPHLWTPERTPEMTTSRKSPQRTAKQKRRRLRPALRRAENRLLAIYRAGEAYPGILPLVARLHCPAATIRRAIDRSPPLKAWHDESPLARRTARKWPKVKAQLLAICRAGKRYPGSRALAPRLHCSPATIGRATNDSPKLKAWRDQNLGVRRSARKWLKLRDQFVEICRRREPYPGIPALVARFGCTDKTAKKAIDASAELRIWRARGQGISPGLAGDAQKERQGPPIKGLTCPDCGSSGCGVIGSRGTSAGGIRRRRICPNCQLRFSTLESVAKNPRLLRGAGKPPAHPAPPRKRKDGPGAPASQGVKADAPVTLKEFMTGWCVALDEVLLNSRLRSLQQAARRKYLNLPPCEGKWKDGQKKFYNPDALCAAWPEYREILRNLPKLRGS